MLKCIQTKPSAKIVFLFCFEDRVGSQEIYKNLVYIYGNLIKNNEIMFRWGKQTSLKLLFFFFKFGKLILLVKMVKLIPSEASPSPKGWGERSGRLWILMTITSIYWPSFFLSISTQNLDNLILNA